MFGNKKHEFKDYGGDFMLSINADIEAFRSGSQVSTQVSGSKSRSFSFCRPMSMHPWRRALIADKRKIIIIVIVLLLND